MFKYKRLFPYMLAIIGLARPIMVAGQITPVISAAINHYDYSHYNTRDAQARTNLSPGTGDTLRLGSTLWAIQSTVKPVATSLGSHSIRVVFTCKAGTISDASVSVHLRFANWSTGNYVLMPAAVYNGNRVEARIMRYSPFINDARDTGVNRPQLISDVPRLNIQPGPSRIQQRTGDMSTPGIGFYSPALKRSYWILTPQATRYGDSGIDIEENRDRSEAEISYTAPVVRELYQYAIADNHVPSKDRGVTFSKGDSLVLQFQVDDQPCEHIQGLFDRLVEIRNNVISRPAEQPDYKSFSNVFSVLQDKFNSYNFEPVHGYYSVGSRVSANQDWQIGWVGGMQSTYPLLYQGSAASVAHVIRNFDWLFPNGISPSGFFWDTAEKGTQWMGMYKYKLFGKELHLVRKSGDGLYYCLKQFDLMARRSIPVKSAWKQGCKTVADALVNTWYTYHQFGQFVENKTGKLIIGGSTSGAIIPAALTLAYRYYGDTTYLQVAKAAAAYYDLSFVKKGTIYGGPGDAMQNFDSEATYALLESYSVLYETTGEQQWLDAGKAVASQLASWITSYDYQFPPTSTLGKLGSHTLGAVWANTQNKHAAPGICTHSGVALLKIYRATGNPVYLTMLKDIARGIPQYLSTSDRPLGKLENGWINERVSTTDWLEGIGELFNGSTWAETSMMLTAVEVPGLYVDLSRDQLTTIDHIKARIVSHNQHSLKIALTNPTKDIAQVKVLAENDRQRQVPLGSLPLWNCRQVVIAPGATAILTLKK